MNEQKAALLFKALSDVNRLRIVRLISNTENMCACNILEAFNITQPTLSHHMKVLCSCGLVDGRKEGKWMHYSLNSDVLSELKAYIELL
ncbi:MAG: metalloregulator ArsR/SmtB family transcription factor [Raoultibacter sp.]